MTRSATDVMQDILAAAVLDALAALKGASRGVPNTLLRDLNAIHANTTFADLPSELRDSIAASVRAAFTRLLKEGYAVSSAQAAPPRPFAPGREPPRHGRGPRPPRIWRMIAITLPARSGQCSSSQARNKGATSCGSRTGR